MPQNLGATACSFNISGNFSVAVRFGKTVTSFQSGRGNRDYSPGTKKSVRLDTDFLHFLLIRENLCPPNLGATPCPFNISGNFSVAVRFRKTVTSFQSGRGNRDYSPGTKKSVRLDTDFLHFLLNHKHQTPPISLYLPSLIRTKKKCP